MWTRNAPGLLPMSRRWSYPGPRRWITNNGYLGIEGPSSTGIFLRAPLHFYYRFGSGSCKINGLGARNVQCPDSYQATVRTKVLIKTTLTDACENGLNSGHGNDSDTILPR